MIGRRRTVLLSLFFLFFLWISSPLMATAATRSPLPKPVEQGGVGLQVVPIASGEIVVIAVMPKSPAAAAKLLPGDLITTVDGVSLRGSNFADVTRSRLWGKAGSRVKITWLRPGVAKKQSAQLVRVPLKDAQDQDLAVKILVPADPLPPTTVDKK